MPRRELPEFLGDAFLVRTARAAGIGEGRLRGPDLTRAFHGSRARADVGPRPQDAAWQVELRDVTNRIVAYAPLLPPGAFFAGPTAAFLHGFPLPSGIHGHIHVGVLHPRTAPLRPGIRGVQVLPQMAGVTEAAGLPVTDPATTWAMLGRWLIEYDLIALTDHLLRIPRYPGGFRAIDTTPVATMVELETALASGRRLGAANLRVALERARTGSSSRPESWMRLVLVDAGLPEPTLDVDVYSRSGMFLGCSELAYPERRLAIEYESDGHLTRAQLERDIEKYADYADAGWSVLRFTSDHIFRRPHEAVRRVRAALART